MVSVNTCEGWDDCHSGDVDSEKEGCWAHSVPCYTLLFFHLIWVLYLVLGLQQGKNVNNMVKFNEQPAKRGWGIVTYSTGRRDGFGDTEQQPQNWLGKGQRRCSQALLSSMWWESGRHGMGWGTRGLGWRWGKAFSPPGHLGLHCLALLKCFILISTVFLFSCIL